LKDRNQNVELAIGVPLSWPYVHSDFFDCFTQMEKLAAHVIRAQSGPISEMRNTITRRALGLGCTHLIFLDADMIYPLDTIPRLLAHDRAVCGGLCFKRWPPFNPTIFTGDEYRMTLLDPYPEGLVEVTATGTACLLIRMDVFLDVPEPWFEFAEAPEDKGGGLVGEDIGFCYKARAAGYKIYVDTTIKTKHMSHMGIDENLYRLNKKLKESNQARFHF